METLEVGSIKSGDRITFRYPMMSKDTIIKAEKVVGYGFSPGYKAPYVDFFNEHKQFAIALPFISHHNGRRVNRDGWLETTPSLVLNRDQPVAVDERKIRISQVRIPFTEEDDLATAGLKTSTRKGLDEMSESHRAHIEKWEDHIESMGAEHVWATTNRFPGRGGEGPVYAAIKRGSKDYAIVSYDTATGKKAKVLVDGFESSKTLMEAFKEYREMAKEERGEEKAATKAAKAPTKAKPAAKVAKKAVAKREIEDDDEDEDDDDVEDEEDEAPAPVTKKAAVKKIARKR